MAFFEGFPRTPNPAGPVSESLAELAAALVVGGLVAAVWVRGHVRLDAGSVAGFAASVLAALLAAVACWTVLSRLVTRRAVHRRVTMTVAPTMAHDPTPVEIDRLARLLSGRGASGPGSQGRAVRFALASEAGRVRWDVSCSERDAGRVVAALGSYPEARVGGVYTSGYHDPERVYVEEADVEPVLEARPAVAR